MSALYRSLKGVLLTQFCDCAVMTTELFAGQPDFETQYWSSISTALTRLNLTLEDKKMTEGMSATLCQLTRLQELLLEADDMYSSRLKHTAVIVLDLPLLERLEVSNFDGCSVKLTCPSLQSLSSRLCP